jgi:hypothetical protein
MVVESLKRAECEDYSVVESSSLTHRPGSTLPGAIEETGAPLASAGIS